jgi:hypothetical protein
VRSQLEHLGKQRQRARVAFVAHDPCVLVLDLTPTLANLGEQHGDGLEDVEGLEPCGHQRFAVLGRDEPVWPLPDHRRNVTGAEEAVEAEVGRLEDGLDRRHDRNVVREHAEVGDATLAGLQECQCGRRGRRLESDGEEHDVTAGCLGGDLKRVERRVHETDVRAARLGLQQVPLATRHAHHVAERREEDTGRLGDGDGVVDAAHRDDAHGAAGSVHQLDRRRQDVLDPVPVDRVRVAPAHLHQLEMAVAGELGDLRDEGACGGRVAILVDEAHDSSSS